MVYARRIPLTRVKMAPIFASLLVAHLKICVLVLSTLLGFVLFLRILSIFMLM